MAEERKLVTVLFADVVGSTALGSENEPEVVRHVMGRYFERMKELAETHGGTVEKFIGDAVMVVFGVPRLHDDDAERAVRCALAMQDAMVALNQELQMNLAVRVGVNSGRAVTGGAEGVLVTGDTVNVAARLQQGAKPGEIVIGALTEELTRRAIEYQPRMPVRAKGKAEPLEAFAALRARSTVPRQTRSVASLQAPFVGRERELRLLLETFGRVRDERRPHLFTVLGVAGIGKSRLVREALAGFAEASAVRILRGRCLPYGKGITYWPIIEILQEDAGITLEDDRETALGKMERRVTSLIPDATHRRTVGNRLAVLLGLEQPTVSMGGVAATQVDLELGWAVRQYLQAVAAQQPVVTVIDDLQWAEPAVIRLLERTALRATEHPILLLCVARPELSETHPGWGSGPVNATSITLNVLSSAETSTLISRLLEVDELPSSLRQRLVERSEGNPLFCEEFLRMLIDDMRLVRVEERWRAAVEGEVRVPESIHAILAARLDGLSEGPKRTLQAASVIGERFTAGQLRALLSDTDIDLALEDLVLKGLVVEGETSAELGQLKFKHLLIRDVSYEAVPKNERAEFHARFEHYIEQELGDREAEFIDILAHHAERAFTLSREVRLSGESLQVRASRALRWNLLRAERALARSDSRVSAAAVSIAQSAAEAAQIDDSVKLRLKLLEADSLGAAGRPADVLTVAREAATMATKLGDNRAAAAAHLCAARAELRLVNVAAHDEANEAARLYRLAGDLVGETEAEMVLIQERLGHGEASHSIPDGLRLAERTKEWSAPKAYVMFAPLGVFAAFFGFAEDADRCIAEASTLADQLGLPWRFRIDLARARLARMRGTPVEARQILVRSIEAADDVGATFEAIILRRFLADVLMDLQQEVDAEAVLERALRDSEMSGERWNRAELLARRALCAVRRRELQAAERHAQSGLDATMPDDPSGDCDTHYALGQLRLAQGRDAEAETAFRDTLTTFEQMDFSVVTAEFSIGIARFLAERGKAEEARQLLDTTRAWLEKAGYTLWLDEISRIRQLAGTPSPS